MGKSLMKSVTRMASLAFLACMLGLLSASSAAADILICSGIDSVNPTPNIDVEMKDVVSAGSDFGLRCVACDCPGGIVTFWGHLICPATCTTLLDGEAKLVPSPHAGTSVPALSVLGTALLIGGLIVGALWRKQGAGGRTETG